MKVVISTLRDTVIKNSFSFHYLIRICEYFILGGSHDNPLPITLNLDNYVNIDMYLILMLTLTNEAC
jgi:hypothetical protein